jgi:ligand-binding sensor domain-containing protein
VGTYDGESWSYPHALRADIHDLALGKDGRLWVATNRGVGIYDGARVRRLDRRRGLVEDRIEDVEADRFGRMWLRSDQALVLITP